MEDLLGYYKRKLKGKDCPQFIYKYFMTPSLMRLKGISYFCGMDYASKDIYDFKEYITRYDHSVTVALLTWELTHDKKQTLAALYHDVGTPCFSHVIDYMNKDYGTQESTEEFTLDILDRDDLLKSYLELEGLSINDIANFKECPVVDNNRPKLCADRLDGVILTGISWTRNVDKEFIDQVLDSVEIYENEEGIPEIGFSSREVGNKVLEVSDSIDVYCHSDEDNYMMQLLADIVKMAINDKVITYEDLFILSEDQLILRLIKCDIKEITDLVSKFRTIRKEDIDIIELPDVKKRDLNPLVLGKRLKY